MTITNNFIFYTGLANKINSVNDSNPIELPWTISNTVHLLVADRRRALGSHTPQPLQLVVNDNPHPTHQQRKHTASTQIQRLRSSLPVASSLPCRTIPVNTIPKITRTCGDLCVYIQLWTKHLLRTAIVIRHTKADIITKDPNISVASKEPLSFELYASCGARFAIQTLIIHYERINTRASTHISIDAKSVQFASGGGTSSRLRNFHSFVCSCFCLCGLVCEWMSWFIVDAKCTEHNAET